MSLSYRRAEKMLYIYPETIKTWHNLLLEYRDMKSGGDVRAQMYGDTHRSDGQVSDPANDYVNRLMRLEERVSRIERQIRGVEGVRTNLQQSTDERAAVKLQILERVYFEKASMMELSDLLGVNYRTLYRRREELVKEVIDEWQTAK